MLVELACISQVAYHRLSSKIRMKLQLYILQIGVKQIWFLHQLKDGVLTVSQNFLGTIQSGILTYIANVQYTDPSTNVTLETQAQMTFSLSKQATEAKYCSVSGESVFLYNSNQTLVGVDTIVLTATCTNVNISQWQYKNASGLFVAMPTTNNLLSILKHRKIFYLTMM